MKKALWINIAILLLACIVIVTGCAAKQAANEAAPPPIGASADFVFGKQAHEFCPATVDEFVPVFATQMVRYSQIAPLCWPNNAVMEKSVVLEDVDTNRIWHITPNGDVTELSEEDADLMGISRRDRPDDFSFFSGGMYITISDQSVYAQRGSDKPHVGAYDAILWLTHEGFHEWEQSKKWEASDSESIANAGREEYLLDVSARAKRNLLQKQLLWAAADPGNKQKVLDALATYEDYKTKFSNDYDNALYYDRIEGTALYFEIVSSIYVFYPDQVGSRVDLERALAHLAQKYEENYISLGVVSESYYAGMLACILLDRLDENWKEHLMQEPSITPLEMLSLHYSDETLPEPRQLTAEELDSVTEAIRDKVRYLAERQTSILAGIVQVLDSLSGEERIAYELFFDEMLQGFQDMLKILPEEEQRSQEDFILAMQEEASRKPA